MNTVKHLKDLSLRPLPKKSSRSWIKVYGPGVLLAALLGTYLDLYLVGAKMLIYPLRPLPEVFSINIVFTLLVLPIMILIFLHLMNQVNNWGKVGIIVFLSLVMPIGERFAELFGLFVHSDEWKHIYSFFGYLLFFMIVFAFSQWMNKSK